MWHFNLSPCICYAELCSAATFFKRTVRKDIRNKLPTDLSLYHHAETNLTALIFLVLTIFSLEPHSTGIITINHILLGCITINHIPLGCITINHSTFPILYIRNVCTNPINQAIQCHSTKDYSTNIQRHADITYLVLTHFLAFFPLWRCCPTRARASSFLRFLYHPQRRITVGRTPLDEWSARRRDLYLTTHNTHNRRTSMPPVGFEPTISTGERPQIYALDRAATGTGLIFWRFCKIAKSGFERCHFCLYFRPHGTSWLPLDRFSLNLIFGHFSKTCP